MFQTYLFFPITSCYAGVWISFYNGEVDFYDGEDKCHKIIYQFCELETTILYPLSEMQCFAKETTPVAKMPVVMWPRAVCYRRIDY